MDIFLQLIVHGISGSICGKITGNKVGDLSSNPFWNVVFGILGGILVGRLFCALGIIQSPDGVNLVFVLGLVTAGGIGGALAVIALGYIKKLFTG